MQNHDRILDEINKKVISLAYVQNLMHVLVFEFKQIPMQVQCISVKLLIAIGRNLSPSPTQKMSVCRKIMELEINT